MPAKRASGLSHVEPGDEHRTMFMRDLVDGQLRTLDGKRIGRAADVEAEWGADGSLVLKRLVLGPEVHLGRISHRLVGPARRLLKGRFDHRIEIEEVEEIGPSVMLRRRASDYDVGNADQWIIDHIFRFIPGSGR
ncbi:MAG: hypothetical protein QOH61_1995 [Chloroflexota bacterium]|jgi:hypothetical protein|nr:hypothetical protein [Chloroflexota bacterium]